jgi:tetratricopeptide (TPR) repeat protein
MRIGLWVLYVSSALGTRYAVAQHVSRLLAPSDACIEFNQAVLSQLASGRLEDAETALSSALDGRANGFDQSCAGLALHNMAIVMARSGRLAEAEVFAERSLKILGKIYPPDDLVLLRPLQSLSSIRFEQRKTTKAREAFRRMQSIRAESPGDRALIHGTAAALLLAEGRYNEAEPEYLRALAAWEESGGGETADAAAVLDGLGALYMLDGRYREAGRTLDRALAIVTSAKDAVPMDRIKLLNTRAVLHARQGEWREAEQDLRSAISTADRHTRLDPVELRSLLANYAQVLRNDHRGREARSIEARAAAIPAHGFTDAVVDVGELLARPRPPKK